MIFDKFGAKSSVNDFAEHIVPVEIALVDGEFPYAVMFGWLYSLGMVFKDLIV